ncbi:Uncharacterised protein [Mycobacteroides abscessus subsp. abscessus]|nr:Uncharacterised protein [Mycobacteroides abscessus subsp. abscessus]
MNGYRGKVGECNLSFLYFEPKKLRYTKRLNDSKSVILEDIRFNSFNSFYKKQVL